MSPLFLKIELKKAHFAGVFIRINSIRRRIRARNQEFYADNNLLIRNARRLVQIQKPCFIEKTKSIFGQVYKKSFL
jgi:hypothetical protein